MLFHHRHSNAPRVGRKDKWKEKKRKKEIGKSLRQNVMYRQCYIMRRIFLFPLQVSSPDISTTAGWAQFLDALTALWHPLPTLRMLLMRAFPVRGISTHIIYREFSDLVLGKFSCRSEGVKSRATKGLNLVKLLGTLLYSEPWGVGCIHCLFCCCDLGTLSFSFSFIMGQEPMERCLPQLWRFLSLLADTFKKEITYWFVV